MIVFKCLPNILLYCRNGSVRIVTYFSLRLDLHEIFEKISNKIKNIYVMLVISIATRRCVLATFEY